MHDYSANISAPVRRIRWPRPFGDNSRSSSNAESKAPQQRADGFREGESHEYRLLVTQTIALIFALASGGFPDPCVTLPRLIRFIGSMQHTCAICADEVPADERFQHPTGDYHKACFDSIAAAALKVERWSDGTASCHLCNEAVAPRALVVTPGPLVVHLRCFFVPPSAGRKSLGAAATLPPLRARSAGLRRWSRVLRQIAARARARAHSLRRRHRATVAGARRTRRRAGHVSLTLGTRKSQWRVTC